MSRCQAEGTRDETCTRLLEAGCTVRDSAEGRLEMDTKGWVGSKSSPGAEGAADLRSILPSPPHHPPTFQGTATRLRNLGRVWDNKDIVRTLESHHLSHVGLLPWLLLSQSAFALKSHHVLSSFAFN